MDQAPAPVATVEQFAIVSAKAPSGFVEGVWHPEDLVRLPGTRWIIVSAMKSARQAGELLAVEDDGRKPAQRLAWTPGSEAGRRSAAAFAPHGIDARALGDGRFELLVVDHGEGEAVDRLVIDVGSGRPLVAAGQRIEQPAGTSGNAVASLPDGGFVVTSMFDPRDENVLRKFATSAPTGSVWRWAEATGWTPLGPRLSGANGIAVGAEGQFIYVSEWAARRVWKLSSDGTPMGHVDVGFLPDNLRWSDDNRLLVAGQIARPERVFGCEARGEPCPLAFAVARLDPISMKVEPLLVVSHAQAIRNGFGGATGALDVGTEIWVGSFTGRRIARYPATSKRPR